MRHAVAQEKTGRLSLRMKVALEGDCREACGMRHEEEGKRRMRQEGRMKKRIGHAA